MSLPTAFMKNVDGKGPVGRPWGLPGWESFTSAGKRGPEVGSVCALYGSMCGCVFGGALFFPTISDFFPFVLAVSSLAGAAAEAPDGVAAGAASAEKTGGHDESPRRAAGKIRW